MAEGERSLLIADVFLFLFVVGSGDESMVDLLDVAPPHSARGSGACGVIALCIGRLSERGSTDDRRFGGGAEEKGKIQGGSGGGGGKEIALSRS